MPVMHLPWHCTSSHLGQVSCSITHCCNQRPLQQMLTVRRLRWALLWLPTHRRGAVGRPFPAPIHSPPRPKRHPSPHASLHPRRLLCSAALERNQPRGPFTHVADGVTELLDGIAHAAHVARAVIEQGDLFIRAGCARHRGPAGKAHARTTERPLRRGSARLGRCGLATG